VNPFLNYLKSELTGPLKDRAIRPEGDFAPHSLGGGGGGVGGGGGGWVGGGGGGGGGGWGGGGFRIGNGKGNQETNNGKGELLS